MIKYGGAPALFPLLLMMTLAGLVYWLEISTEPLPPKADANLRHDPDATAEKFTVLRYGPDGRLHYQLVADYMEHYPDDDSSLIQTPRLTNYRPQSPDVTLIGKSALVTEEGKRVLVQENVVLTRAAFAGRPALVARTPELTVLPDEGKAFNQHPVQITQGDSWINGVGLQMDNNLGTFVLQKQVRGAYVRNPAP
ncbi:MAG: LPS export ABC transporter periplasmic protein LptC [Zoogloeaceae bacterium]|jgi:lipopolysaccharide export system protein LptC|nr:LPS export ABC transporter periplasmic protein LptC [Zoogloeaceae bacterium]